MWTVTGHLRLGRWHQTMSDLFTDCPSVMTVLIYIQSVRVLVRFLFCWFSSAAATSACCCPPLKFNLCSKLLSSVKCFPRAVFWFLALFLLLFFVQYLPFSLPFFCSAFVGLSGQSLLVLLRLSLTSSWGASLFFKELVNFPCLGTPLNPPCPNQR